MRTRRGLRSSLCRLFDDLATVLARFRVLAAEAAFTVAALYGVFRAVWLLSR